MSTHETPVKKTIPSFATREEQSKFWDTHDIADHWEDLKLVTLRNGLPHRDGVPDKIGR